MSVWMGGRAEVGAVGPPCCHSWSSRSSVARHGTCVCLSAPSSESSSKPLCLLSPAPAGSGGLHSDSPGAADVAPEIVLCQRTCLHTHCALSFTYNLLLVNSVFLPPPLKALLCQPPSPSCPLPCRSGGLHADGPGAADVAPPAAGGRLQRRRLALPGGVHHAAHGGRVAVLCVSLSVCGWVCVCWGWGGQV